MCRHKEFSVRIRRMLVGVNTGYSGVPIWDVAIPMTCDANPSRKPDTLPFVLRMHMHPGNILHLIISNTLLLIVILMHVVKSKHLFISGSTDSPLSQWLLNIGQCNLVSNYVH